MTGRLRNMRACALTFYCEQEYPLAVFDRRAKLEPLRPRILAVSLNPRENC